MSKTLDELNKFNERCKEEYIKKVERHENIKKNYISKQKVKDLIINETINISGFECIAVEDVKKLLEDK